MNRSFDSRLRKLQKKRADTSASFSKLYRDAQKRNEPHDELGSIDSEARMEDQLLEYEIESLVTWELVRKAEHLFIPIPPREDDQHWKESYLFERVRHLTPLGVSKVRDAIREEEKKRREARIAVVDVIAKIVVMLTGLVGATIGLVSILIG